MTLPTAIAAGVGLAWVLGFAHGVFQGLDMVELLALFAWIGALLIWPLVQDDDRAPEWSSLALFIAGVAVMLLVRFDPPWSPRHPQATLVSYVQDIDSGKAYLASPMSSLDPWTTSALTAHSGHLQQMAFPAFGRGTSWVAAAAPIPANPPSFILQNLKDGTYALTATPSIGSRNLSLEVASDTIIQDTAVNGRPIKVLDKPGQLTRIRLTALPKGFVLTFKPAGPGKLNLKFAAVTEGWPAGAKPLPPRDSKTMAFDLSDSTAMVGSRTFTW
jgi:hypothetical protein